MKKAVVALLLLALLLLPMYAGIARLKRISRHRKDD